MRYLNLNLSIEEIFRDGLDRGCPWRLKNRGRMPKKISATAKYETATPKDEQFGFPSTEPRYGEISKVTALALRKGIKASFQMHTYKFRGWVYQQAK